MIDIKDSLYSMFKIPIRFIIDNDFNINSTQDEMERNGFMIEQGDSILFDQIRRITGKDSHFIEEFMLVDAKKNPKQEEHLRKLLRDGFTYNGKRYKRFGKSQAQGKLGITAFVSEDIFDELYKITQMDIEVDKCVISKYESQRCLVFSSCTLIKDYMPNIVIVGEYKKTIKDQNIKYVVGEEKEYKNKTTGETGTYIDRVVKSGKFDLEISPFDGCGCHEKEFMEMASSQLGLDYNAIGMQIRLPFMKGYSVYVPFRQILKDWGIATITDVYGKEHLVDEIDCIWNISMFKGHGIFKNKYGDSAWDEYMNKVKEYDIKLGISKYSHHVKNLNLYTRMNFQYIQCLDLWDKQYIKHFTSQKKNHFDILDENNDGKVLRLARYTTSLFEKIINGDTFYSLKFMGIVDSEKETGNNKYAEAVMANSSMLKDSAVRRFIYRKLQKTINEAKVGKIYCHGFYHTGVGDMIGYLQYAAGLDIVGCLKAGQIYSGNFESGAVTSFRSPLVDPSEVNNIRNVRNEKTKQYFDYFVGQDVVMFNMYDISAPQQGGADYDGDIFLITDDKLIHDAKIKKEIILDIDDKVTSSSKDYTMDNIIEYELMTRDTRIGEITNVATSIENKYTRKEETKKKYADYSSLLRIYQGKEIDFLKTGFRWNMNSSLRNFLKQIPYFLLYNYPKKMDAYKKIVKFNEKAKKDGRKEKKELNAYHSPSPMNELCDYICTWEKKKVIWDNGQSSLEESKSLVVRKGISLDDKDVRKVCRRYINTYSNYLKSVYDDESLDDDARRMEVDVTLHRLKKELLEEVGLDEETVANYVIDVSYDSYSISKSFAWSAYGDYIVSNVKENSDGKNRIIINEANKDDDGAMEYLGKYYTLKCGDVS